MNYDIHNGVTQSLLGTWLSCRQRALNHIQGWRTPDPPYHTEYGNLFHHLLEHYYGDHLVNARRQVGDEPLANSFFKEASTTWSKKAHLQGPVDEKLMERNLAVAQTLWPHYVNFWHKRDDKMKFQSTEEVFDTQWRGVRLRGKIDGTLLLSGKEWILETKTKSQISEEDTEDTIAYSFQNLFMLVALRSMKRKPIGYVYNVIRNPSFKDEDLVKLCKKIASDVVERPDHYFKRFEVVYTEKNIAAFEEELASKLAEFTAWCLGDMMTYKNETACIGRGRCPYIKACASGTKIGYVKTGKLHSELEP